MFDYLPNPLIIPVGLVVGVLIAAPVGPVNIICIQRAISRGMFGGIAAGLGAVLGDGLIALAAALGVGAISGAIERYHSIIQMVGGIVVAAFGVKLYLTEPELVAPLAEGEEWTSVADFVWDIPKTFFLTITNPGAVLGLIAIFGGVSSFVEVRSKVDALTMVAAIMAGSLAWWVLLSSLIGRIRHRLALVHIRRINQVAGILLVVFGAVLVGELILKGMKLV
jgi:threonine/homoserine/homoserine lactone efflux protein